MNPLTEEHQKVRDEFLNELTLLTRKYKIKISGCGCCGSPCLSNISPQENENYYSVDSDGESLIWVTPEC